MPKQWTQKNAIPALMAGLAAVLLLLAALQYRWIGEISEADSDRLRRGLRVAAEQFRRDFNRELASLAAAFPLRPAAVARRDWEPVAEDYARWVDADQGGLQIEAVYIQEAPASDGTVRTLRLNPDAVQFEPVEFTAEIRGFFDSRRDSPRGSRGGPMPPRTALWAFLPRGPALSTPLIGGRGPRGRGRSRNGSGRLLVVLDREAVFQSLLPEIESRFVVADGEQLYQLAVLDPATSEVLFSNADIPAQDFWEAELQGPLIYSGEDLMARFAARRARFRRPDPIAPNELPPGGRPEDGRLSPRAVVTSPPNSAGWILATRHSGGSLGEVVSGLRRRNLAISFGILLLLSAGMGLALLSARRAERLAQLQMEFVAGVSHELRTPIAVIRQAADNLAEGIVSSSEQTREYGRLMRAEGRRLTNMVEQTLQFASSQAGRQRYAIDSFSPTELIAQAVEEVRLELSEAGVELEIEDSDNLPAVKGDASAITQCVRNLLSNAIKYRGKSKKVTVSATTENRFVRIDVSDSGLGIDAEDLPHIFDPFYRGRPALDEQIQGSGLGLSLAKEAAEAAGGSLDVTSHLGSGSTFTLRLPISTDDEASA